MFGRSPQLIIRTARPAFLLCAFARRTLLCVASPDLRNPAHPPVASDWWCPHTHWMWGEFETDRLYISRRDIDSDLRHEVPL